MTLAQLKTKANAKLTDFWSALVTKQDAYFAKHGNYFQLLVTNPVVDGTDTTFEVIHPNDEKNLVDVDFTFNSPIPFQIQVDEWSLGDKAGYIAVVLVELLDGRKFERSRTNQNVDSGWYEVIEDTL